MRASTPIVQVSNKRTQYEENSDNTEPNEPQDWVQGLQISFRSGRVAFFITLNKCMGFSQWFSVVLLRRIVWQKNKFQPILINSGNPHPTKRCDMLKIRPNHRRLSNLS